MLYPFQFQLGSGPHRHSGALFISSSCMFGLFFKKKSTVGIVITFIPIQEGSVETFSVLHINLIGN